MSRFPLVIDLFVTLDRPLEVGQNGNNALAGTSIGQRLNHCGAILGVQRGPPAGQPREHLRLGQRQKASQSRARAWPNRGSKRGPNPLNGQNTPFGLFWGVLEGCWSPSGEGPLGLLANDGIPIYWRGLANPSLDPEGPKRGPFYPKSPQASRNPKIGSN